MPSVYSLQLVRAGSRPWTAPVGLEAMDGRPAKRKL